MVRRYLFVFLTAAALIFSMGAVGSPVLADNDQDENAEPEVAETQPLPEGSSDDPYQIADIAEETSPSTVFVHVEWPHEEERPQDQFGGWFFPMPPEEPESAGTGFFIEENGTILTNQHVVGDLDEEQEITVTVSTDEVDGEFEAELIGADYKLDLAVLQIKDEDAGPFPVIPLGDSDQSRPGEWVIAIGNPYGKVFEHTVTVGVLSAKGREIQVPTPEGDIRVYDNLMQTDAAINQGNSGGPLLNMEGEVIGINTAVHAQAQGIGFAIPINVAAEVLDELIETGRVDHDLPAQAWLGIWYLDVSEEIAARLNLPDTKGIIISDVVHDSPAQEAGLQSMDVVRRVEDEDIETTEDFAEAIEERDPGDEILLNIIRDGEPKFITVELGDTPIEKRW